MTRDSEGDSYKLVGQLATRLGQTIPLACQDWTNTKAAYRFLSNGRVRETAILAGHFQSTRERFAATDKPIVILRDTTEFSFTRESQKAIGILYKSCGRKDQDGRPRLHTVCGIRMHSSLAVTTEGLPLGLAAIKFWTRSKFKGINFSPAVSDKAVKAIREEIRSWNLHLRSDKAIEDLSRMFNPIVRGWLQYYGRFYRSALYPPMRQLDRSLARWAERKYKKLRGHLRRATHWVARISRRDPKLSAHWQLGVRRGP